MEIKYNESIQQNNDIEKKLLESSNINENIINNLNNKISEYELILDENKNIATN